MHKKKLGRASLAKLGIYSRALILIGSVLAVITALVSVLDVHTKRQQLSEELEARLVALANRQAVSVSNSLWDLNRDSVRMILQGLAQDPDFVSATVTDENGEVFVGIGAGDTFNRPVVSTTANIILDDKDDRRIIGDLTLVLSQERLLDARRQALEEAVFLGFVQLIAVLIATALVLRAVIRPLADITDRMVGVAAGELDSSVPHQGRADQIGDVARAVESFRTVASERLQAQEALRGAHDELEQRVAERTRELNISEKRFRDYAEASADWFWEMDADLRFTYMSSSVKRTLGVPPEWHYGRTREELLGEDYDRDEWAEHLKALQEHRPFRNFEYLWTGEDVESRWVRVSGSPIFTEDGGFCGYRGSGSDITEQKTVEAGLEASEEQLRQAQKMEAVGQLTGGVAHDFNNLLTVILGNLQLARDSITITDDSEVETFLQLALRATMRGADLTQRLLAYSRRQALKPEALDVNQLAQAMSHELLRRTLGEDVAIELHFAEDLPRVLVDPVQLESAILNLALNARDAMPEGGTLTIETASACLDDSYAEQHPDIEAGSYVLLAVSDTGMGIPPDVIERAIEPFFTTKEVGAGSGLGLSMVYGFLKQSGGHLNIYSEVDEGTTVKLYLPIARKGDEQTERGERIGSAPTSTGGEAVLVVEDDPDVRRFVHAVLTRLGYAVLQAADGPSALVLLGEDVHRLDLLLTDVVLPGGMRGPQLADEVRKLFPNVRTLFMSGYTKNVIVHHGSLDEGVELLDKPFDHEALATRVRKILLDQHL